MDGEAREIQLDGVENRERLFRSNIKNRCEGNKLKETKGRGGIRGSTKGKGWFFSA